MIRPASLAVFTALALGAPAAAMAAPDQPVAAQVEHVNAPTQASAQDTAQYAQRDQQDKQVQNYQGGNVVVIGISGTALVVLLLILLLV